jgi:hypothetical protein
VIGGSRWKEPSSPSRRLRLRHQGRTVVPAGRRRETRDPAGATGSCLGPLPVLRQVLGAGPGALPGEAADHGSQNLGHRGGLDLQRVHRPAGAGPRCRAPGNPRAPLVVGLVVSHPAEGSADPAPDGAGTGAVKPSVRLSGTPPREWPSRATFSETTSWTPSQPIWSAAGQRCVAGPSPVRRDTSDDYYDDLPVSPPVVRCLAVDLVAVERDGVVWLDPPRLKARVANQRLGQGVRSGDQGAAQVDLGSNAPGLVLGPEQVG